MVCLLASCHGYVVIINQMITDIDECELYEFCDQGCVNLEGSYKCICKKGYYWSGGFGIGCFGQLIIVMIFVI